MTVVVISVTRESHLHQPRMSVDELLEPVRPDVVVRRLL